MKCTKCKGKGLIKFTKSKSAFGPEQSGMKECPKCNGTGKT